MKNLSHGEIEVESSVPPASDALRVLVLEDNPRDAELCIQVLRKAGFELQSAIVDSQESFAAKLQSQNYDVVLADFRIPGWNGAEAFRSLKKSGKDIPFILVTGALGEETAVDLIKEGITDYILKDRLIRLPSAVRRALKEKSTRDERERATKALGESEEQVRLLLDSTAEAIYGIDMQGRCTFCNAASLRLLGYHSPNDLLGKQMHSLVHQAPAKGTSYTIDDCQICTSFREGNGSHSDAEILWKRDGSSFPVEYWAYPILRDRKPIGSVVTFLDITKRKAKDMLLLRKVEELDRSNRELEQFIYVGSHDLQEPLRMVVSYTQLLSKRYKGKLDADADEYIAFAVNGAVRMQRLIQDLLAYSRVGTKGRDMVATSSDDALQQALQNLRGATRDSGALVTYDRLPAVLADETQLIQLFQNIIGNAIRYQNGGVPHIQISAAKCEADKWAFSVKDNGIGIDSQHFERIFRMFQRLHNREEFDGTGVGLAICKKIVERHGGEISVESQPGQGSTFRFTLTEAATNSQMDSTQLACQEKISLSETPSSMLG
jgi:PAS domain S-box-containing protein